jgi:hypothetical protein
MGESTRPVHVQGLYMLIVAIISLLGGYFLREPIDKTFFPKYSNIGGVWKAHGDLLMHCDVSIVNDSFYIIMQGEYTSGERWQITGHGKLGKDREDFTAKMSVGPRNDFPVWGHAEMAGSDQLGVTIFFDEPHTLAPKTYAFMREISSSLEIPKNSTQ